MELTVPILDDGVVALRRPESGDIDPICAICKDPGIARFTTVPSPYEREHAVNWFEQSVEHWADGESASFVIVDAATGELLGNLGVVRLDRAHDVAEVGYLVKREVRGRGMAPLAVNLVASWVLGELGFGRLELLTDVRNHASQRVAEKAGFVREGEVEPPDRCRERSDRMFLFARTAEASAPAGR
jgi:RimJ/RimL family protein N-acetyltransferase